MTSILSLLPANTLSGARLQLGAVALLCGLGLTATPASAQTALADGPLFSANSIPGNLGLVLSVEFPTAISVAHTNRTYSNTTEYLGYFAPEKCYDYQYDAAVNANNYFYPSALAATDSNGVSTHVCNGKWSGNFLNWATMQTIDPFRWVLTGGYRVVDDVATTVIEKAWGTNQGGTSNFPDSSIGSSMLAGATPFPASSVAMYTHIWNMGNKMRFTLPNTTGAISFAGQFWNTATQSGPVVLTRTDTAIDFDWGTGSPGTGVNADNFSARWTATVTAPTAGSYTFRVAGDDRVQLKINGTLVINQTAYDSLNWKYSAAQTFTAGQTFTVDISMAEDAGGAAVKLQWIKPGDTAYSNMGSSNTVSAYDSSVTATPYSTAAAVTAGGVYDVYVRAKVCDTGTAHGGVEKNCTAYGSNWKPEGLLQKYANRIRYSAFGYLNDSNIQRDGGVLRARQKFVGPTQPVPGSLPTTNAGAEWNASTGVFVRNPNATDASDTNTLFGLGSAVADSGVINYLNKFGQTSKSYKTYDNVGELYYAAIRYFKNLGNVPEWTNMGSSSTTTKTTYADGFPVITTWDDPILYSCQRNFLLGIGDVNTHADKNVPGNSNSANEPSMPAAVTADTTVNAVTATNKIGVMEGLGSTLGTDYVGSGTTNAYTMAGLAYDSHTKDIRPDTADPKTTGLQTIDTYWVDVQEYQAYRNNNQFYLATKYGGFKVPTGFDPYASTTTTLTESWWHTNTDTLGTNKRPDNYYSGGRPDLMKTGLETAFADIASKIKAYTTSFSTSLPQVAVSGNKSYSSLYDASTWSGEIVASELNFNTTSGDPTLVQKWVFTEKLAAQIAVTGSVIGWDTNRRIATWTGTAGAQFCTSGATTSCTLPITSAQLAALDPSYVTGNDSVNYLKYLRGDTSNEQASTSTGSTKAYRTRAKPLGDIVGSKARPVGPPSLPLSDAANPGYSAFKATWAPRPTVVYVGSNDGMMHAIQGDLTGSSAGRELFAYVPSALFQGPNGTPSVDGLASLGNPSFSHHFLVNQTPDVHDVDFSRTVGGSGAPDWRSILIGGLGKGGKSYYAIDVTDPVGMSANEATVASKVLWEFKDTDLGYTYGDPIVVKTNKYGWVVIIPSGYNNSDNQGHLLILNPRTGALLEKVSTGAGSSTSSAGLAFANAWLLDSSDGVADAVYAGDLLGNLWRWDVSGTGALPAPLKIASLTEAVTGTAQPVTSRPVIAVHPSLKKRVVMVGTGRLLDSSDISNAQGQSFYAILDGTNAAFNAASDLPSGITFPITRAALAQSVNVLVGTTLDLTTQIGWVEDLGKGTSGIGWRVTTDATTALGSVAWAATLPSIVDPCSPSGLGRIYARDFATSLSTVKDTSGLVSYVPSSSNVTDLRYISVNGKLELISGSDMGEVRQVAITPPSSLSLRRLNWRELQTVD